jgi:hypothetical protein
MTAEKDFEKLGGFVSKVVVSAERKVWSDKAGSHGVSLSLEANVAKGADLDAFVGALSAYAEAYCGRGVADTMEQVRQTPDDARVAGLLAEGNAPAEAMGSPPPVTTEEVQHVSIKKFSLMEKPGDKFELQLFPDIKGQPGKWAEIKFTANREAMWNMLRSVWDNDWKPPVEKEVDWVAEYKLGREYEVKQGEHKGETKRYKDLVNLHTGS